MATSSPASPRRPNAVGTPTHVSEPAFEFLLHAMIEQVEIECQKEYNRKLKLMKKSLADDYNVHNDHNNHNDSNDDGEESGESGENDEHDNHDEMKKPEEDISNDDEEQPKEGSSNDHNNNNTTTTTNTKQSLTNINTQQQQQLTQQQIQQRQQQQAAEEAELKQKAQILMNENIAAKMERIGFDVGYRLVERLSQSKSLIPPSAHTKTPTQTQLQLEAVKFICKEFWTEIYRKQIDKLQTNHKGVFVLKDSKFKWLDRMPSDLDIARSMAIKILALPCGLIRGALSNLGIAAVVSCDFMDDGENMNSCSFNVKIK